MDRSSRGLIYILITVLVIVLIIAIGVIVYMGMKMMDMQNAQAKAQATQRIQQPSLNVQEEVKKAIAKEMKQLQESLPKPQEKEERRLKREDIAAIVGMVMAQMQQKQAQAKAKNKTAVGDENSLDSQIEKIVDSEGEKEDTDVSTSKDADNNNELDNLLSALESVDADSVDEEENGDDEIDLDSLDLDKIEAKEAKGQSSNSYNKVVVKEDNDTQDDLAKLGGEIEQLIKKSAKEVKESEYEKRMKREVRERKNEMRTIIVRRGDTLTLIAKRAYGSGRMYKKLLRANPRLRKNPNRIFVGQRLRVPR